ncbi:beta strand repeat-containing protein [Methanobacterium formicicum]|uniref:Adhesin-like protein n=2 Tax=Methanobacterium formicicum TaxID=2162 RepID=A0A0S4FL46_METFO|nr:Ig-like domain repeat protein [Methanobacterium formicicum]CEL23705.1 hypothetical protein MB9_0048 [Methanobacterium formicicum]
MENQNKKSIPKIPFLLLIGVVLFSLSVSAVSAANTSSNSTIYVSTEGNDTWDGLSPTYNTTSGPKKTITNATGTVTTNGTIYIAPGTYNESGITINKDMTITGENQENTIINGQQSGNSIFHILTGITANINNLTLTNSTSEMGGAIYNGGNLTVTNCTFTNNTATYDGAYARYGGGAIYNEFKSGILTVKNCTFTNNTSIHGGGAIYNKSASLTVTNSTFTNNTATRGSAIYNDLGKSLTVTNCTFTNNTAGFGTIYNYNSAGLTVINSTFTNNTADSGGAIHNDNGADLTVTNCTFTNNTATRYGGAIENNHGAGLTVTNCTFTNNTANSKSGGAIDNSGGGLTVTNSTFTNNYAYSFGGAITNTGNLTAISCIFTNNTATSTGSVIWSYQPDASKVVVVHFNRIVGNNASNSQIHCNYGIIDARFNWWGSNLDPSIYVSNDVHGSVDVSSWLVLNITNPDNIFYGGNSTVSVDLLHDNTGTYHDPVNGHVPDGIVVDFASDMGNLEPVSTVLVNGSATSVFTTTTIGSGNITATVDNQTVSTPITINQSPTTITVDPVNGHAGQTITINTHITDSNSNPVKDGKVTYKVNGTLIGNIDVSNGLATITWTIPTTWTTGIYNIIAEYSGSVNYLASNNTTNLTVTPIPTTITVDPVNGDVGETVNMTAHATDFNGNPVNEGKVTYKVNGTIIGNIDVSNGLATITWTIPTTWIGGVYSIIAEYSGSVNYLASINTTNLTVNPTPTTVTVDPVNGHAGQTMTITTHATDSNSNPVKDGQVTYKINSTTIGTVDVINGLATINWTIPTTWNTGTYNIIADYSGSANYLASINTTNLTVNPTPTNVTVDPVNGHAGQTITINTHITDSNSNPVKDGKVTYKINGTIIGNADVINGLATITWTIPTTWIGGVYSIIAEYSGSVNYLASNNTTNLTVNPTPTNVTVDQVNGHAGQTITINTHITDSNSNPVKDGKVTYKVNGTLIGTVDVSNGLATINWTIPTNWTSGIYNIIADYSGSSNYLASTNGTSLTLQPSAYLYMNVTSSKVNPSVGDKFVLTYKLSNSGPDDAANVVVSFQIPEGLEFVTASVDSGTYTYNPTNRTITWTLNNVKVGDPYLYLTLQALTSGKYTIIPTINSQTHNRNTDTIKPFNINIEAPNNNNPTTANAASNTITMQKTGTPTTSLILAILAILGGILTPKKK